ncbi:MAG TPA: hypothetical protein VFG95_07040, partial [Nitrospiria bacterium]|nr:hypothetical protein [Nitrospiria bacterium]
GFNNRLIVMGGRVRNGGRDILFEKAEAFETAKGIWEEYPLTKLPVTAAGVGVCSMANLFILGGETQGGISDRVHSVDQLQRRWIEMEPLPEPRAYATVLTNVAGMDNSIYLLGGRDARGAVVDTVFAFKT